MHRRRNQNFWPRNIFLLWGTMWSAIHWVIRFHYQIINAGFCCFELDRLRSTLVAIRLNIVSWYGVTLSHNNGRPFTDYNISSAFSYVWLTSCGDNFFASTLFQAPSWLMANFQPLQSTYFINYSLLSNDFYANPWRNTVSVTEALSFDGNWFYK